MLLLIMFLPFSFPGSESIERGDNTGGKPIPLYQLHVGGKNLELSHSNQEKNIFMITVTETLLIIKQDSRVLQSEYKAVVFVK